MDTIGTFDNLSYKLLDVDLASGGTVRSLVVRDALSRSGCSVQLTITGSSPANLVLRVLGKNTAPASDTERLLPLSLAVPDLSGLVADYTGVFLLPMYTAYMQLEVQSISGAAVHVRADVLGTNAAFDDAAPTTTIAGVVQLAAGAADVGTFHLATGAVVALATAAQTALDTLAGAIASGSIKALLQAGSAAIGKLGANSGVNIGSVDVLSLPSLPAGTNVIGHVIEDPSLPPHQAGSGGALVAQAQAYAAPCTLRVIVGYNADTVQRFVQLHNKATALAPGDVPLMIIPVPADRAAFSLAMELVFSAGLSIGISSTELTYTSAGSFLSYEALVAA